MGASQMPSRICKGDKVRLKKDRAYVYRSYGVSEDTVMGVSLVEKVGGRPRLYVDNGDSKILVWANDCVLAWGKACKERREALGL